MAKNLIANEGSLELHEDGVLKETYPKTLLHVKPISNNSVRVTLLDYKKLYFDLSKGDSVQGVVQSTIEDLLTEASKLSLDASGGGGSSEPVTWDTLEGKPVTLATPTSTVRGGVLQASAQTDSTATDVAGLVTDFNALLAKLRTAGVIA